MKEFLELLQEPAAVSTSSLLAILLRLALSGVLGTCIALLYRVARPPQVRHTGLLPALVLLAMLITLVTMAVGSNIAVAFTLVGTLAIVRFRTTVSDVRDTVFVIFAVAIGIAVGQSVLVASLGLLVVGVAVACLIPTGTLASSGATHAGGAFQANVELQLELNPPNADPSLYLPTLERFGVSHLLRRSRIERGGSGLRLNFDCEVPDLALGPELVTALLERPEVARASLTVL